MNEKQIVSLFGGIRPMARALGHKCHTVVEYWANNGIPIWRRHEILQAAKAKKIKLTESDFQATKGRRT